MCKGSNTAAYDYILVASGQIDYSTIGTMGASMCHNFHQPLSHWLSLPSTSKLVDIQVSRQRLSFTGAYWGRGNPTPQADIVRYISQPVDAPQVSVEPRPLIEIVSQAKGTLPIQRSSSNGCVWDQIRQLTTTSIGGIKPFPALNLQAC